MNNVALVLAVALGIGGQSAVPQADAVYAAAGCCKARSAVNASWSERHRNLTQCRRDNQSDGDDVYRESGLVWWDVACR